MGSMHRLIKWLRRWCLSRSVTTNRDAKSCMQPFQPAAGSRKNQVHRHVNY
jgi:hypothetical protein